ncbi:MAG: YfiR family protein [Bacteroidales bacterium]
MNKFLNYKIVLLFVFFLAFYKVDAQEEKYITLYLYNFTKYIEWPDEYKEGDFVIDILGHKSVYERLKPMLEEKQRGSQNFVVNNPTEISAVNEDCHILFVGHWQSKKLEAALEKIGDKGTLVVTEKGGLLEQGSAINLVVKNKKIAFEVKKSNLSKYGLSYSNDLTSLAERVVD